MKPSYVALALLALSSCKKKEEETKKEPEKKSTQDPKQDKDKDKDKQPVATADAAPAAAPDAGAAAASEVIKVEGFDTPESALYDPAGDVYLISNIGGPSPLEKDDKAFISKVTPDGKAETWIDSAREDVTLDAPKGMAIRDGVLYVTDIDVVRKFDLATGAPKGEIKVEGATFLNDLVLDDDVLWLSDTGLDASFKPTKTDAIYRIEADDKVTKVFAEGLGAPAEEIGNPNGVLGADQPNQVWVVTFGSGELYKVTVEGDEGGVSGSRSEIKKLPKGQLDGIVAIPDGILVSSWEAKAVYKLGADGNPTEVITGVESPADIGFDDKRSRVVIPLFTKNVVEIHPLK
jgi:sugar lactone lactonase YvrE